MLKYLLSELKLAVGGFKNWGQFFFWPVTNIVRGPGINYSLNFAHYLIMSDQVRLDEF